jgi:hypothetical protein
MEEHVRKLMKLIKSVFIPIVFLLVFLVCTVQAESIDPSNPNVQYMGRWNFDNPSQPWAAWKGCSIKVKFDGTAITADLDAGEYTEQFRVIIDGVPNENTLSVGKRRSVYTLASGLSSGEHVVEIMKETFVGTRRSVAVFYGFEITGTIMAPPAKPVKRIEFFGDSNMDGSSLYSEQNSGAHGSYYAYPAVVSRMLNAEFNDQSVAGAKIDDGGDNCVGSFIFSEDYYNQDLGYRSGFDPHIIVINAGANDINDGKETIKNRYKAVIADLRNVYGSNPHIVLWNAYGWDPDEPAIYTHEVVTEVGGNLSACVFPWMWEQWHGCMTDHSGQANLLADHILSLGLGFTQVQNSEIFDGFGRNFNVANGGFEGSGKAGFDGFGWRYYDDPGVERIYDPAGAYAGDYYLRLTYTEGGANYGSVQQGTDATGDFLPGPTPDIQQYTLTAMMRGTAGAQAEIIAEYQIQQTYDRTGTPDVQVVNVTTDWQQYDVTLYAPAGMWLTYIKLRAAAGTVEFDEVSMAGGGSSSYCDDGTCDPGEDQCNCPEDCGIPPTTETSCTDGIDEDCDTYTDCDDIDCDGDPACIDPYCGDGTCDPGEDQCNCSDDCGDPPATETDCTDGIDEDCDLDTDCDDIDCEGDPACPDCALLGEECVEHSDCCENFCHKGTCKW